MRERRLETTAQGRAFIDIARATWPCDALDRLLATCTGADRLSRRRRRRSAGHRVPLARTLHAFLHALTSNWISAAVRLVPLGQTDGQRVLASLEPLIHATAARALVASLDDLGSATFRADIGSMRHESQYTRLFRSELNATEFPTPGSRAQSPHGPLRVGIGGPVGSGKTALMDLLCKSMRESYDIAAITNDIYTKWDAEFLVRSGSLTPDRIAGVETGGCPHTAIREDASMNLAAVADMRAKFPDLDLVLIESGGDNLAATFSPELADLTIYVIDVAAGDKIPSKGGPGITRSDLLVINKIDLAPHVGASLDKMGTDATRMRGERPFVMTNLKSDGLDRIVAFIEAKGGLRPQAKAKAG